MIINDCQDLRAWKVNIKQNLSLEKERTFKITYINIKEIHNGQNLGNIISDNKF
jgi:hypothetical protein